MSCQNLSVSDDGHLFLSCQWTDQGESCEVECSDLTWTKTIHSHSVLLVSPAVPGHHYEDTLISDSSYHSTTGPFKSFGKRKKGETFLNCIFQSYFPSQRKRTEKGVAVKRNVWKVWKGSKCLDPASELHSVSDKCWEISRKLTKRRLSKKHISYIWFNIFQRDLLENLKQKADDKEQRNEVEDWKNKYENLDNELQLLKTRFVFVFVAL